MGQNDSSNNEQDIFFQAIENAVDDLFTQYEAGEDGTTKAPKSTPDTGSSPAAKEATLEFEGADEIDKAFGKVSDLLGELNQAFLTIDWEVNQTNIGRALDVLSNISREIKSDPDSKVHQMLGLMEDVLKAIGSSPESVSTSAPKALRDCLGVLTQASQQGTNIDPSTEGMIEAASGELSAALSGEATPESAPTESVQEAETDEISLTLERDDSEPATNAAPAGLLKILLANLSTLDQCISRLVPVENLFSKKPGHEKLLVIYQKIRESMTLQKSIISTAIEAEYHPAPQGEEVDIPTELKNTIQNLLTALEQCKKRIVPVENLFAQKPKFAKLHVIHQKLRGQIETQIDSISRAMVGDYKPSTIAKSTVAPPPPAECSCPWASLRIGQWKGKTVAFIADHIAYERSANGWTKKNVSMLAVFPLKKLKPFWPWSHLRPRFRGTITQLSESELRKLALPVLNHPDPVQNISPSDGTGTLLVLYSKKKGGVILLDSETQDTAVKKSWRWQPSKRSDSIISGNLKTDDQDIPVIDLNNL